MSSSLLRSLSLLLLSAFPSHGIGAELVLPGSNRDQWCPLHRTTLLAIAQYAKMAALCHALSVSHVGR